jgi:hypothetical protein
LGNLGDARPLCWLAWVENGQKSFAKDMKGPTIVCILAVVMMRERQRYVRWYGIMIYLYN